jgi:hypothetical protein
MEVALRVQRVEEPAAGAAQSLELQLVAVDFPVEGPESDT